MGGSFGLVWVLGAALRGAKEEEWMSQLHWGFEKLEIGAREGKEEEEENWLVLLRRRAQGT